MPVQAPVEIFGTPHSDFVRAVRVAIAEKGLPYEYRPVRPHSPEALAVHPIGLVPGLKHGEVVLGESQAIIAYLDDLWPESPMGPSGPIAEAAEITQFISIVATAVDQDGSPGRAAIQAVLPDLRNIFAVLDARLSGRDFLADRFTFADALLLATLGPAPAGRKRPKSRPTRLSSVGISGCTRGALVSSTLRRSPERRGSSRWLWVRPITTKFRGFNGGTSSRRQVQRGFRSRRLRTRSKKSW